MTHSDFVTVEELLQEEVGAELHSRDGQWSAFREQVLHRIDRADRVLATGTIDARATEQMRAEVEAELTSMAPRFEGPFRYELDQRIFRRGIDSGFSPWTRLRSWLGFGGGRWILAAATAMVLIVVGMRSSSPPPPLSQGEVVVEALSLDGRGTVMASRGVTVLLLSDGGGS